MTTPTTPSTPHVVSSPSEHRLLWSFRGAILVLALSMLVLDTLFAINMQKYLDDPHQGHYTVHSGASLRGSLLVCDSILFLLFGALVLAGLVHHFKQRHQRQRQDSEDSSSTPEPSAKEELAKAPFVFYWSNRATNGHAFVQGSGTIFLLVLIIIDFVPYPGIVEDAKDYRVGEMPLPPTYASMKDRWTLPNRWEAAISPDQSRIGFRELYFCAPGFYRDDLGAYHLFAAEGGLCRNLRARTGLAVVVMIFSVLEVRLGFRVWKAQELAKKTAALEQEMAACA